jgi:hypothetical protein
LGEWHAFFKKNMAPMRSPSDEATRGAVMSHARLLNNRPHFVFCERAWAACTEKSPFVLNWCPETSSPHPLTITIPCSAMFIASPVLPLPLPPPPPAATAPSSLPLISPCCRAYSGASPRQLPSSLAYCKMRLST